MQVWMDVSTNTANSTAALNSFPTLTANSLPWASLQSAGGST